MSSIVYFVNLHILVKGSHSSGSSPCSLRSGVFQYFLMLDPDSCVVYDLRLCLGVSRDGVSECVSECVSEWVSEQVSMREWVRELLLSPMCFSRSLIGDERADQVTLSWLQHTGLVSFTADSPQYLWEVWRENTHTESWINCQRRSLHAPHFHLPHRTQPPPQVRHACVLIHS